MRQHAHPELRPEAAAAAIPSTAAAGAAPSAAAHGATGVPPVQHEKPFQLVFLPAAAAAAFGATAAA